MRLWKRKTDRDCPEQTRRCEICDREGLRDVTYLGVRMVECPVGHAYVPAASSSPASSGTSAEVAGGS